MFTMLNVVYDHFLTRKPPFFTLFILSRTSDNTGSQNIGGTNAWAVPPPQILGRTFPQTPLGLHPCTQRWPLGWAVGVLREGPAPGCVSHRSYPKVGHVAEHMRDVQHWLPIPKLTVLRVTCFDVGYPMHIKKSLIAGAVFRHMQHTRPRRAPSLAINFRGPTARPQKQKTFQ